MSKKILVVLTVMCIVCSLFSIVYATDNYDVTYDDLKVKYSTSNKYISSSSLGVSNFVKAYSVPEAGDQVQFQVTLPQVSQIKRVNFIIAEYNGNMLENATIDRTQFYNTTEKTVTVSATVKNSGNRFKLFIWDRGIGDDNQAFTEIPTVPECAYENLVSDADAGMENENTEWTLKYTSAGTIERSNEKTRNGMFSRKVTINSFNGVVLDVTDAIKNNGVGEYRCSCWVCPNVDISLYIRAYQNTTKINSSDSYANYYGNPTPDSLSGAKILEGCWAKPAGVMTITDDMITKIDEGEKIYINLLGTGTEEAPVTFYMDDFSLIKVK